MKRIAILSAGLAFFDLAASAAPPDPAKLHAWYRADGLKINGARITAWENAAHSGQARALTRVAGMPRAFLVKTPAGVRTILRLNGKSALWQTASSWGTLDSGRTVLALGRIAPAADGYLFDGSTKTGRSGAQVLGGKWRVGVDANPAEAAANPAQAGAWQAHAFVFDKAPQGTTVVHSIHGAGSASVKTHAAQPLSGFILGADVAAQHGLECDVAEVLVYDRALTGAELESVMADLSARWGNPVDLPTDQQPQIAAPPEDPRVFRKVVRTQGDDKVHTYRIPGLATSTKGTLLAVFDIRHNSAGDLPADIDVGLMRSTDGGKTWGPMQCIIDFDAAEPASRGNGVGDPSILVDAKTGAIFVAALWSKGARAWAGSGPGLTPEETGQFVISKSTDDGATWSRPINITEQVKDPAWRLCFNGPGNGIQLKDGTLVFPAQFKGADNVPRSCFIASRDGGATWKISPPAIPGTPPTSEAQIAELQDGSLLLSMRNESRTGIRAWARWQWTSDVFRGAWSEPWLAVPDPTCMASLIAHPSGALLSSSPNHPRDRVAMTIRASRDGGRTWTGGRLLDPRPSAYSCMTVLKDGSIGILYETGDSHAYEALTFARFPLEWVLEK